MGFHKRYIDNKQVIYLFQEGGAEKVINWYSKGVDSLILESGLSSDIHKILNDVEWSSFDKLRVSEEIIKRIHQELGIEEINK